MPEQISTLIIIAISVLLFCYWFRYACLLILSARTAHDYALDVVLNIQVAYPRVQEELKRGLTDYGRLQASLDQDYELLTYLVTHGPGLAMEDRMVQLDYHLLRLGRRFTRGNTARFLGEMSMIVAYFANRVGQVANLPAA